MSKKLLQFTICKQSGKNETMDSMYIIKVFPIESPCFSENHQTTMR